MPHLILFGASTFDNAAYTTGGPAFIDQVQQRLPAGWAATLLAVDGDTTADIHEQLERMPADATHLVLSVGGNDALDWVAALDAPARSVKDALSVLTQMKTQFQHSYRATIAELLALNKPLWAPARTCRNLAGVKLLMDLETNCRFMAMTGMRQSRRVRVRSDLWSDNSYPRCARSLRGAASGPAGPR